MSMNTILRTALLERVSTDEQAKFGDSIEAQHETLVAFANDNNMKIAGVYRDEGFSARKSILKRPAMLKLIEDIQAGKIDIIIFTKIDRFFRNVQEYYKLQEILERNKVTWRSVLEDYNTTTADGRLKVNIMLSVAENEADRTSERIKFVFQSKIMRKEVIFPPHSCPFGYKVVTIDGVKKLIKNDEQREATEYFFSIALTESTRQAAIKTNHKFGITRDHKAWHSTAHNEIYTGTYKGVEDYCEPYITQQQFQEISRNKTTRKSKGNRVYLFSGLIICPKCGRTLKACYSHSPQNKEKIYLGYRCSNRDIGLCDVSRINELKVEKYLLENIKTELEKFILSHEVSQPKKPKKKSDAAKLKEQLRRVNVSYQMGNMEDAEYISETKLLKARIEKAIREEETQETVVDIEAFKELLNSGFEEVYNSLTQEEKQRLWRSLIAEICYDGHNLTGIKFKV